MGFGSALVDRARIMRPGASTLKLEGRTQFAEIEPGTWFDCRLTLPTSPESLGPGSAYKRVVRAPTLLYATEDENGDEFTLDPQDYIEVESEDLGTETWQVTAAPEPLRRKTGIIGYQTTLKRIELREFAAKT